MLARKQRDTVIKRWMARAVASEWLPVAGQVITGVCLLAFARDIYYAQRSNSGAWWQC